MRLGTEHARDVPLAGGIVGEHDVAGLETFFTPLLASISHEPDIVTRYCRPGAGWRSRTVAGATLRKTAMSAGRESVVRIFLVAAEFELDLFKVGFLITAGVKSGDFHLILLLRKK